MTEPIDCIKSLIINPINGKTIKLIKYNTTVLYFEIENIIIKITTDFNNYCIAEEINANIQNFNLSMIFKTKSPLNILNELICNLYPIIKNDVINIDNFHIYQKIDEFTKYKIDYNKLQILTNAKQIINKIPLNPTQIYNLIITEIKKINGNRDYGHYIVPYENSPYILDVNIKLKNGKFVEIRLLLESNYYPFMPPKLEYIKPKIKLPLLLALININILKLEKWSSIITLEYLIINIAKHLEIHINDNLLIEDGIYDNLEYQLIKLASLTKLTSTKIEINIDTPVNISTPNLTSDTVWKSGTGYGHGTVGNWDIKKFIQEQELQNNEIIQCLKIICEFIIDINDIIIEYIINQTKGLNMLELDKNKELYICIFNILQKLSNDKLNQIIINKIAESIKNIYEEIEILFKTIYEKFSDKTLQNIYKTCFWFIDKYEPIITETITSSDIKEQYCDIMKKLQFNNYEIPSNHRFSKFKNTNLNNLSIIRILSEISSFKKDLPLNWESSIWVRVPKTNFNLFSFLISGPKDTPYENGLFEFHAYFPSDYPAKVPQVLLQTTGNDTFRFNPNLYANGKVCLSLLGTWAGQEGESWNAKTSTFLQVMVSIQSLILVEKPFFNEPGYESKLNSPQGITESNKYNDLIQSKTIQLAMIDMIQKPPIGFEEVVINHFKMKKEEIINKTLIWQQSNQYDKNNLTSRRNELLAIL